MQKRLGVKNISLIQNRLDVPRIQTTPAHLRNPCSQMLQGLSSWSLSSRRPADQKQQEEPSHSSAHPIATRKLRATCLGSPPPPRKSTPLPIRPTKPRSPFSDLLLPPFGFAGTCSRWPVFGFEQRWHTSLLEALQFQHDSLTRRCCIVVPGRLASVRAGTSQTQPEIVEWT